MQIKPRFEKFKIINQFSLEFKDDTNVEFFLSLCEVLLPSNGSEIISTSYEFFAITSSNKQNWNNGAIGYQTVAFWKEKPKKLFNWNIEGINIQEYHFGENYIFGNYPTELITGYSTNFRLTRL